MTRECGERLWLANILFAGRSFIKPAARGLALAAAIAVAPAALADELQFVPLQDYLSQTEIADDPAAMAYVANRCSAFYATFAKSLEGETDPTRQQAAAQAWAGSEKFLTFATKATMKGTTIDFQTALARTTSTVIAIGHLYHDRIERTRNLTGNMFSDPLLAGDLKVCGTLLARM